MAAAETALLNTVAADLKAGRAENAKILANQAEITKALAKPNFGSVTVVPDKSEDGKWGYQSFGQFLGTVKDGANDGEVRKNFKEQITKRLHASGEVTKAASGMNEAVDSEGGFLVPPTFSNTIFQRVYENDILSRCDKYTVTGRTMKFPCIDETSRVDGSRFGGVLAYWADEANTVTAKKPKFRMLSLTLRKLMALGYVTEELIDDAAVAMDAFLTKNFTGEIEFQIGAALLRGDGASQPLGILNAPCKVAVAKESGQAAASVVFSNITKMWQRMWAPSRKNATWFINQDIEHQLYTMTIQGSAGGVFPAYLPPGGLSESPYGTLMGRPVVPVEFCSTLGTEGDIVLADMSQYVVINKGSIDTQMSMHLRFDYDEMAYRSIFRIDGSPWWATALTPYKGTATQSPIITLQTRS